MATQMRIGVSNTFGLIYRDSAGNIAHPVGSPVWNTGSSHITLVPSGDGQRCVVTDSMEESTQISVDLGNGITDTENIESEPGPATSVEIVLIS